MTYEFEINREDGIWTAYNDNGQEIDSGNLPLTESERKTAILEDNGVSNPVRDALQSIYNKDWEDYDTS